MRQLHFKSRTFRELNRLEHGGEIRRGKRKLARPLDRKRPVHLVMRAEIARGSRSLLQPRTARFVRALLNQQTLHYEIRIYQYANIGNHLHLLIGFKTRAGLQNFLRVFAGKIGQRQLNAKKGSPGKSRFWTLLAYTRIISWGREYKTVKAYVANNLAHARLRKNLPSTFLGRFSGPNRLLL